MEFCISAGRQNRAGRYFDVIRLHHFRKCVHIADRNNALSNHIGLGSDFIEVRIELRIGPC